jgi:hypothetical protein
MPDILICIICNCLVPDIKPMWLAHASQIHDKVFERVARKYFIKFE